MSPEYKHAGEFEGEDMDTEDDDVWIEEVQKLLSSPTKQNRLFHSGGEGSGFKGHSGRPGEVGGSSSEGSSESYSAKEIALKLKSKVPERHLSLVSSVSFSDTGKAHGHAKIDQITLGSDRKDSTFAHEVGLIVLQKSANKGAIERAIYKTDEFKALGKKGGIYSDAEYTSHELFATWYARYYEVGGYVPPKIKSIFESL